MDAAYERESQLKGRHIPGKPIVKSVLKKNPSGIAVTATTDGNGKPVPAKLIAVSAPGKPRVALKKVPVVIVSFLNAIT